MVCQGPGQLAWLAGLLISIPLFILNTGLLSKEGEKEVKVAQTHAGLVCFAVCRSKLCAVKWLFTVHQWFSNSVGLEASLGVPWEFLQPNAISTTAQNQRYFNMLKKLFCINMNMVCLRIYLDLRCALINKSAKTTGVQMQSLLAAAHEVMTMHVSALSTLYWLNQSITHNQLFQWKNRNLQYVLHTGNICFQLVKK